MEAFAPLLIVIICSLFFVPISECLSCYECSPSAQDDCTDAALWRPRNVSCPGFCYAYPSGSSVTLGCIEDPEQDCPERCCQTDLCNTGQLIDCYQCTYRNANGVISGHESCTRNHFNVLHPQVKRRTCSFGCAVSEILAEDNNGYEYIISRDCAVGGYCPDNECPPGAASCTSCCHTDLCNDKVSTPEEPTDREERNECFSCSYIKGPSGMIHSPACWEPFNASGDGITTVPCDGECSLEVIRDSHSLIVRRGCQPGCDPSCTKFGDSENCRYCCRGDKCNSAPNPWTGLYRTCVFGPVVLSIIRIFVG